MEALVAIRLAGRWSKREKRPPKTFSKNVYSILKMFCFLNHLFYDWLCVDLTSAFSTCSCQRVICKPFCESESFRSCIYSYLLESYLVLDKAGLAKVLEICLI